MGKHLFNNMRRGEAEKQPQSIKFSHAIRRRNKK
jgi:hypothetical protein